MKLLAVNTLPASYTQETRSDLSQMNTAPKVSTETAKTETVSSSTRKEIEVPVDTVSITNEASSAVTESREEKVLRIQKALADGTYQVSTAQLTDSMIKAGIIKMKAGVITFEDPM